MSAHPDKRKLYRERMYAKRGRMRKEYRKYSTSEAAIAARREASRRYYWQHRESETARKRLAYALNREKERERQKRQRAKSRLRAQMARPVS